MRKHELEADNIVLISIVENDLHIMQCSVQLLKASLNTTPHQSSAINETIAKSEERISRNREFLAKLYEEGKYPQGY